MNEDFALKLFAIHHLGSRGHPKRREGIGEQKTKIEPEEGRGLTW